MRMFNKALWLLTLPLVSGCMTSNTLLAIKHPTPKDLHDYVDKLDGAAITESNRLLIFFEGRLTNSSQGGHYTIVVPLSDARVIPYLKTAVDTNELFKWGVLKLPRSGIVEGWGAKQRLAATERPVPLGPPILHDWYTNVLEEASKLKPVPGTERTLFQVIDVKTNSVAWPDPLEFIYIDATHAESFTDIKFEEVTILVEHKEMRLVLPFAIVGDIATSPFQLVYLIMWFSGAFGSG